ncbi:MAG: hypothetical protein J5598_01605, partial [Clostridia bacterium]|nr:hypothetical protein [Clostridia bacterium]
LLNASRVAPYFDPKDVVIYLQGSYACKSNTQFQSKMEMIVEITKTREYDYDTMTRHDMKMRDNFFIDFEHYFDVKRFKDVLANEIARLIHVKLNIGTTTILVPAFGSLKHAIDIFPCFKYKYFRPEGGSIRAKLVYDEHLEEHFLMFTNLHAVNGNLKDTMTQGNFKRIVRLVKNAVAISAREDGIIHTVRGYYIECLLYNVPNEMYFTGDGKLSSVFLKVINWLNFANLDDFVCENQIWSLWGNADGFWNQSSARQFVNDLIEFYEAFPEKRTEIIKKEN